MWLACFFIQKSDGGKLRVEAEIHIFYDLRRFTRHRKSQQNSLFALCSGLCRVGFDIRHTRICHKFYCGMGRDHARHLRIGTKSFGYNHQRTAAIFFYDFCTGIKIAF